MTATSSAPEAFDLNFPRSGEPPRHRAGFRVEPSDFVVEEESGFAPAGGGEHLLVHVRKTGENTRWVARSLASAFGVPESGVGYCGLKDRRAVTSQWFSVHLPGGETTLPEPPPGCEWLDAQRHWRKLRPGDHAGNHFRIRLRFEQEVREELEPRLERVAVEGVPNYFGEQRFGIDGQNLQAVARIVHKTRPRFRGRRGGLYLSAARAWLFNQVLAARVVRGDWRDPEAPDGPLWGRGRPPVSPDRARDEAGLLESWQQWCQVLEHSGLKQQRRSLVLAPGAFRWCWHPDQVLELGFFLPPGAYATAVLRELAELATPPRTAVV